MTDSSANESDVVFEAAIAPYRSLSRRGVRVLVAALSGLVSLVVLRFWLIGAWPVVVFSLLEVPLAIALLALNMRRSRASELIMLSARSITVIRTDSSGKRSSVSIPADWLNVSYNYSTARLLLQSRGQQHEIGAFLHAPDKQSLCDALELALDGLRHPRFDNPQLRD